MRLTVILAGFGLVAVSCMPEAASAQENCDVLLGGEENPPVVSDGRGRFRANVRNDDTIRYRLRYRFPDGTTVLQAHLHVANPGNNGGIAAYLCTNVGGSPNPVPECLSPQDDIRGTIRGADVQDTLTDDVLVLAEGDLAGLGKLIEDGAVYVNVHTAEHTGGELRCQVNPRRR
ncbi:MAG TPA: CHRD domain-containing protein [Geminicoccaceae bacterium]